AGVAVLDRAAQQDQIPARDILLLHLERGLMLHRAGAYEQSALAFVEASRTLEEKQTISISEQTRSFVSNDWSKSYLGEYSERLWAHSYAMMSFLMLGEAESAAVEARQAVAVLEAYPEPLRGANFTRALIGLSFEMAGQYNDAYVAYRALHQQMPNSPAFALATYRAARQVASSEGMAEWRDKISVPLWQSYASGGPEAVLLLSVGRGPVKTSSSLIYRDERLSFPSYLAVPQVHASLSIIDNDRQSPPFERVSTDVYALSAASLSHRGKQVLAKAAVRGRIKHELVKDLRRQDETAAEVLNVLFFLLEEADTRSWESLPARLSLLRVPLQPEQTTLTVQLGTETRVLKIDPAKGQQPQIFSIHFD
ncbi:MAG: hypothetical protein ACPGSC_09575, partial [Granulosicoccaceae bacterium]